VIGRRDRLPLPLLRQVESTEARTRSGTKLHLRIAIDYSARDALLMAAVLLREAETPSRETFRRALAKVMNSTPDAPDVDLLIRTGGNQRLSDFLLWESAYAELLFTECLWPDFGEPELRGAVEEFFTRDRRFGRLSGSVGPRHSSPSVAEAGS
jgi:undecaprenyl diphosphate synthase